MILSSNPSSQSTQLAVQLTPCMSCNYFTFGSGFRTWSVGHKCEYLRNEWRSFLKIL